MNEQEFHKGVLKPIRLDALLSFHEMMLLLMQRYKVEGYEEGSTYFESDELIYLKGEFYELHDKELDSEIFEWEVMGDEIHYVTGFHNGGTCLEEVLGNIVGKVKKQKQEQDKVTAKMEEVLEKVTNMTTEEYLIFFEQCQKMREKFEENLIPDDNI